MAWPTAGSGVLCFTAGESLPLRQSFYLPYPYAYLVRSFDSTTYPRSLGTQEFGPSTGHRLVSHAEQVPQDIKCDVSCIYRLEGALSREASKYRLRYCLCRWYCSTLRPNRLQGCRRCSRPVWPAPMRPDAIPLARIDMATDVQRVLWRRHIHTDVAAALVHAGVADRAAAGPERQVIGGS